MKTTVLTNASSQDLPIDPEDGRSALEYLREHGFTAPKLVCVAGACGACTILVDGEAVNACVLPAVRLAGRTVRTAASLGTKGGLHPVQRAFAACDGLQCGFCTPGFVVEAAAFHDRWRELQGTRAPTRATVNEALAGHLCRCGAYAHILDAVVAACTGEFDEDTPLTPPRVEAEAKVTGEALYTVDKALDGQLVGRILRSRDAHAKVVGVDVSPALALEGVIAAIPLVSSGDRLRHVGAAIAAVAATSAGAAAAALRVIHIEVEALPAVFDLKSAMAEGAPVVFEKAARASALNSSEGPISPARWDGNVRVMRGQALMSVRPKDAARVIAQADAEPELEKVQGTFRTVSQIHTPFEPHAVVARWVDGKLEVHMSTQAIDMTRDELVKHYGLQRGQVALYSEHVGGGFGSKQGVSQEVFAAIDLSKAAEGRPVAIIMDRREELTLGGHRPGTEIDLTMVADRHGVLRALELRGRGDGGVSVNSTVALLARSVYLGVPKILEDVDVATHLPGGKPFRAPFGVPFTFAIESAVDEMAHRLSMDPIELRQRWDSSEKRGFLYAEAAKTQLWQERGPVGSETGRFRRGIGVAMGNWFSAFYSGAVVEVSSSPRGLSARTTTQDIGNGTRSVIAQSVAEVFGLARNAVHVEIGRAQDLPGPASSGSRTTNAVHHAAVKAARTLRDQLAREAGLESPVCIDGGVQHAGGFESWDALLSRLPPMAAKARRGSNGIMDPLSILPSGAVKMNVNKGFTGAVYLAETIVDTRLGTVRVPRVWAGLAAGRILMPRLARNQIHGAIVQGLGFALHEARTVDAATGTITSATMDDYRIPGIADAPEVDFFFHEEGFEHVRGKVAGLSELATVPVSAAIANSVHHATGTRHWELPILPERVLGGDA